MDHLEVKLQFLEVLITNILYQREIYPKPLFRKRKIYNLGLFQSIYPPLNCYLQEILKTAKELKQKLYKIEMVIYKEDEAFKTTILENYVFELKQLKIRDSDEYLTEFEEEIRKTFQMLENRSKVLKKLPKSCKFKILLHTTENCYLKINSDPNFQDFMWIKETKSQEQSDYKIVPFSDNLWFHMQT